MPLQLLVTERNQTARACVARQQPYHFRYGPFGDDRAQGYPTRVGYIGQWRSSPGEIYLLGQGRRAYFPRLRRFAQADRHSPFDSGGANSYAYCAAEPVNRTDVSGAAFTPLIIVGIVAGASTASLQFAQVGIRSAKATPARLMWGLRLGILAGVASVASGVAAGILPDERPERSALAWSSVGLSLVSATLRLSVALPQLREVEAGKVLSRVLGLRSSSAPLPVRHRGGYEFTAR